MSNFERNNTTNNNHRVTDILWYVLAMVGITIGAMIVLGILDIAGAMIHTALSANFSTTAVNYVADKKGQMYFAHIFLRALIAAFALMYWCCSCEERAINSFVLRVAVFAVLLAGLDFVAFALEFLGIAFWRAITSGIHDVQIINVIKLRYLDHIDILARVGQAFVAANAWFLWQRTKVRAERRSRRRREQAERQAQMPRRR